MASKTGYKTIFVKITLPNTQPSGKWSGNNTPITFLDKGTYFCNMNVEYAVGSGSGNITLTLTAITSDLNWDDVNSNVICSSPNTGAMGVALTQPMRQQLGNTFTLTQNNVPIYLHLECNLTGVWGTTVSNSTLNIISFTKISA